MLPYPVWESEKKKYKALVSEICVKGNRYRMQGLNAVMFFFTRVCVWESFPSVLNGGVARKQ